MALGSTNARGALADINVTPMVDVMLVLLVIFMVTAPMMTQGVAVQLPTAQAQPIDTADRRSVLTLTKDRRIYLGDTEIVYAELRDKLVGNIKLRDDREVNLYADRTLDYGFVVDIMAILKDAGVESLGMVTEPATASPRARRR